jgi:hypothetical protein
MGKVVERSGRGRNEKLRKIRNNIGRYNRRPSITNFKNILIKNIILRAAIILEKFVVQLIKYSIFRTWGFITELKNSATGPHPPSDEYIPFPDIL